MDLDTLCKQLSASVTQQLEASIREELLKHVEEGEIHGKISMRVTAYSAIKDQTVHMTLVVDGVPEEVLAS